MIEFLDNLSTPAILLGVPATWFLFVAVTRYFARLSSALLFFLSFTFLGIASMAEFIHTDAFFWWGIGATICFVLASIALASLLLWEKAKT